MSREEKDTAPNDQSVHHPYSSHSQRSALSSWMTYRVPSSKTMTACQYAPAFHMDQPTILHPPRLHRQPSLNVLGLHERIQVLGKLC